MILHFNHISAIQDREKGQLNYILGTLNSPHYILMRKLNSIRKYLSFKTPPMSKVLQKSFYIEENDLKIIIILI